VVLITIVAIIVKKSCCSLPQIVVVGEDVEGDDEGCLEGEAEYKGRRAAGEEDGSHHPKHKSSSTHKHASSKSHKPSKDEERSHQQPSKQHKRKH
jgi:hypothetical protein